MTDDTTPKMHFSVSSGPGYGDWLAAQARLTDAEIATIERSLRHQNPSITAERIEELLQNAFERRLRNLELEALLRGDLQLTVHEEDDAVTYRATPQGKAALDLMENRLKIGNN